MEARGTQAAKLSLSWSGIYRGDAGCHGIRSWLADAHDLPAGGGGAIASTGLGLTPEANASNGNNAIYVFALPR